MSAVLDDYDDQAAWAELAREREWMAEQVAKRIESGLATKDDAKWIRDEFGLDERKG